VNTCSIPGRTHRTQAGNRLAAGIKEEGGRRKEEGGRRKEEGGRRKEIGQPSMRA
jgi:hypothetical protein